MLCYSVTLFFKNDFILVIPFDIICDINLYLILLLLLLNKYRTKVRFISISCRLANERLSYHHISYISHNLVHTHDVTRSGQDKGIRKLGITSN